MPRRVATKGTCYICKRELSKGSMKTHLLKCNKLAQGDVNYFLIKVEGFYDSDYWIYVQAKENAALGDLDSFLRDIWLECCGHLSAFKIGDTLYEERIDDEFNLFARDIKDMDKVKLKDILRKDMVFKHEYDFGSTTTLKLKVMDEYSAENTRNKITLIARNVMARYICKECEEKAEYIALEDEWGEYIPLCSKCAEICEENNEHMYVMPITNSPRMGVCAYTGKKDIYQLK